MYRLFFLCFVCLISCQDKNESYSTFTPPIKQNSEPSGRYFVEEHPYIANNPTGIYSSSTAFMHSVNLQINEDNTFEYSAGGCTSKNVAKGNWRQFSNKIILKSFPEKIEVIEKKEIIEEKVITNTNNKYAKDKLLRNWIESNANESIEFEFSFISEIEINNWELKVGKDFLLSEIKGDNSIEVFTKVMMKE